MDSKRLDEILERIRSIRIAVIGDFFLDRYFDIDRSLSEISIETGLEAYQIAGVRCYPGAAGTVTNNLSALGVGELFAVGFIGDDGEGFELRRGLEKTRVKSDYLLTAPDLRTPTYTKPLLKEPGQPARELSRLDTKNRSRIPAPVEDSLIGILQAVAARVDGLIVIEQVLDEDCGVITRRVREALAALGDAHPGMPILVDSRSRIGQFRRVIIKPNRREALKAAGIDTAQKAGGEAPLREAGRELSRQTGRPIFITDGENGIYVAGDGVWEHVPAYRPQGPIDIVGAGDSVDASVTAALCAGANLREAALIGTLVSSITIEQIGVTGTAGPEAVRRRLAEYQDQRGEGRG